MARPVLEVRNLRTEFLTQDGVVPAVGGLSLEVAAGEIVGVVGESGSGKSTVALSIMRLLPRQGRISAGQILVDGRDIIPLSERQMCALRGAGVAMVFQDALSALDPTMKVGRQLMEPLRGHLRLSAAEARRRAVELFTQVGIPAPEARLGQYPHQFSGGMRQRAMIAIALACHPKVLLADEPTTALDVSVQRQILDLLLRLRDQTGAGIVLISHDVDVVGQVCDRVVVMYAGRVVESGPTERVFRQPRHPYTIGLLNSSLGLGRQASRVLQAIPGLPPHLTDLPPGCPFWPRCSRSGERCRLEAPALTVAGPQHEAACWHQEDLA